MALDQLLAEIGLELGQRARQRRLRHVQLLGGAAQAAFLEDGAQPKKMGDLVEHYLCILLIAHGSFCIFGASLQLLSPAQERPAGPRGAAMRRSSIMIITGRRAEGGIRLPVALLAERKPSRA